MERERGREREKEREREIERAKDPKETLSILLINNCKTVSSSRVGVD